MVENMNRDKVLVTGASGFLGSHVCEACNEAGYEVHALVRPSSSLQWLNQDWLYVHKSGYENLQAIAEILTKVDYVIHCAGVMATTSRNEADARETNLGITRRLAEESVKAGIKRFVFTSSLAAGGPGQGPEARTEDDPDNPVSDYGRSKKEAEQMLSSMSGRLSTVILRYSMIYGPRDRNIFSFFKRARGRFIPLTGKRTIYTSIVHVMDAARAAVCALVAKIQPGSVYQITDGVQYTMDSIYGFIEDSLGKKERGRRIRIPMRLVTLIAWFNHDILKIRDVSPDQVRQFKGLYWFATPAKARRELGWEPEIDIVKGMSEVVKWYHKHGWLT
ncbi:NAD-dependent epimerase/dehydratase family protein [candidate division WOR-3 bacterium]|uniref:NAD-dependent epimerase/dehydratase family protein n=1 Tax=candidate division WOR-3 bacterium TaxID=2052148 RepID=A0A9D5KA93_UNCW3|nr:NAD-dependent epimerase/dehydratase family protein [candidate division WOR-3 bacterium]MBD3365347.1 NAD-dependent epimerase/dehydratase family protein [candidate division WOR-3 bacterium]